MGRCDEEAIDLTVLVQEMRVGLDHANPGHDLAAHQARLDMARAILSAAQQVEAAARAELIGRLTWERLASDWRARVLPLVERAREMGVCPHLSNEGLDALQSCLRVPLIGELRAMGMNCLLALVLTTPAELLDIFGSENTMIIDRTLRSGGLSLGMSGYDLTRESQFRPPSSA